MASYKPTEISLQGIYTNDKIWEAIIPSAQGMTALAIYPYGKRWFLPCYKATGYIQDHIVANNEWTVSFQAIKIENLTDSRYHARFLRWLYIKVYMPIKRKGKGIWVTLGL